MVFSNFPGGAYSSLGTCLAEAVGWVPHTFNDIYLVTFIVLVAVLAQQTHMQLIFMCIHIYKHEKVEMIVFQVVDSCAHPRTVLALGRTLWDAQCCWLEFRRVQPHVKNAGDGFATSSPF